MPGQVMQQFLNQGGATPGKAAPTTVLPPSPGQHSPPNARQQQAAQAQQVAQAQQAAQQASQAAAAQAAANVAARKEQARVNAFTAIAVNETAERAEGLSQRLQSASQSLNSWADRTPTPGGIGVIIFLLLLFLWAIVPVNGDKTRLQLLWLTLTGRTQLASTPDAANNGTPPGGVTVPGGPDAVTFPEFPIISGLGDLVNFQALEQ